MAIAQPTKTGGDDLDDYLELDPNLVASGSDVGSDDSDNEAEEGDEAELDVEGEGDRPVLERGTGMNEGVKRKASVDGSDDEEESGGRAGAVGEGGEEEERKRRKKEKTKERKARVSLSLSERSKRLLMIPETSSLRPLLGTHTSNPPLPRRPARPPPHLPSLHPPRSHTYGNNRPSPATHLSPRGARTPRA